MRHGVSSGVELRYDKIKISRCERAVSKTILRVNLTADKADLMLNYYGAIKSIFKISFCLKNI